MENNEVVLPLQGIRVLELAGLAPGPFCGLILADFGADVVRIDRASKGKIPSSNDFLGRGKRSIALDMKSEAGKSVFLSLASKADVVLEPFRPGVMEKLGLGPDVLLKLNPRLIYARLTGWGQNGDPKVFTTSGHDINYLALTGVLGAIKRQGEKPMPPANLVADFAGGGLTCALGILLAILQRNKNGKGQVIDAAMVDGAIYLSSFLFQNVPFLFSSDINKVGTNLLDSGAPFYGTYECKDGNFMAVGCLEPQFYSEFLKLMKLDQDKDFSQQVNKFKWPIMTKKLTDLFKTKTRSEWTSIFEGTEACVSPVLTLYEASESKHNKIRQSFIDKKNPAPAPRLSSLSPKLVQDKKLPQPGQNTKEVLIQSGLFTESDIEKILLSGDVVQDGYNPQKQTSKL
eukprot:c19880_g1_i3.p1 GENE.c19880_g1_i3~~c19880_g1_i3.p1  ORF type:complete len:401 (+),score=198.52 c19880_g1_i3:34-1236(+)